MSCKESTSIMGTKSAASLNCTYGTIIEHREVKVVFPGVNAAYVARNALWSRGQVHSTSGRRPLYSQTKVEPVETQPGPDGKPPCQVTYKVTETINKAYL
jgi:hypothetical protein